jgi:hypothetical protein
MQITDWPARVVAGRHARALDIALRFGGVAFVVCAFATCLFERHEELLLGLAALPMALAFAAVLLFWTGLILLVGGAELFRAQPMPPRSWLPARRRSQR